MESIMSLAGVRGQGVLGQIFDMKLCCSPGYGGPGTFYGIEKSCRDMPRQSWPLRARFWEFDRICIGILPKIRFKKDLFFLTPPPVLDLET